MAYHKKTHHKKGKASKKHHKTQRSRRGGVNEKPPDEDLDRMEKGKGVRVDRSLEEAELGQNGGKRRTKKRSAKRKNKSRKMPKVCLMCKKKCNSHKCSNCGCPTCNVEICKYGKSPKSGKSRKSMIKRLLGM